MSIALKFQCDRSKSTDLIKIFVGKALKKTPCICPTDFTTAYYGLPLNRSSMKYAGVVSPSKGVFVYTRGCMGLPGSEVALEELTNLLFGDMVMKGKVAKLADDLYVGGETIEELYSNFEQVLGILLENNLKLKAKKTYIAPKSVTLLG